MIIDVHAHYYPPEYLKLIGRPEEPPVQAAPLRDLTIDDRLELMDRQGIDIQVLSLASRALPSLSEATDAAAAAKVGNDLYVGLCREHVDRFFMLAALPLPHVNEAVTELERIKDEKYMVGATIGCSIAGRHVDDPEFNPVYEEFNRQKAAVLVHPVGQNCVVDGADYNLNWLVGGCFEDTIAALRLALSGTADRFPDIRFIIPHLGGTLPFLLARILRMTGGKGEAALRRMYYDTVSGSTEALKMSADFWGNDHILYGSDFPYERVEDYQRRLTFLDEVGFTEMDLIQIKGERTAELLGIVKRLASS